MRKLLAAINRTRLKYLLFVRWITQSSDGLFQTGLASFVLFSPERSPSGIAIATGFALILLPYSGIGPFVGIVLDRYHRRTVIITANIIRSVLLLTIATLVWTDSAEQLLAPFVLAAFGLSRLILAGFSAGLPRLVPSEILVPSNAIAVTGGTVASVIGGGIGVAMRSLIHFDALLITVASVGYLVAAGSALKLTLDELGPHEEERHLAKRQSVWRSGISDVTTALAYLAHRPVAPRAIARVALIRGGISALVVVAILSQRKLYGESESLKSLALMAGLMGLGSLVGAVLAPHLVDRYSRRAVMNAMLIVAAPFALLLLGTLPPAVGMFCVALCGQAIKVTADAEVQQSITDEFRGRVFAVYDGSVNIAIVLGAFLTAATWQSPIYIAALWLISGTYFWRSAHH